MINLSYAIKRTPVGPKALKWILLAQARLNDRVSWSHERLNLAPIGGGPERPALGFPFVRIAPMRIGPYAVEEPGPAGSTARIPNAIAAGSTKTRSLWECHVIASFLRYASEKFPEIVCELRDDTAQFVLAGAVAMQSGKLSLESGWIRAEQERILEMTGDPQSVSGLVWAQAKALHDGIYLADASADETEVLATDINMDPEDYQGATTGELAAHFVRGTLSDLAPVAG
jgi:hypothetical protein